MRNIRTTLLATTAAALLAGITFASAQDAGREHGTAGAPQQAQPNRQKGAEGARAQGQEQKAQPQRQGQNAQGKQGQREQTTGQGGQGKQAQPQRQGQNEQGKQGQREQTTGQGKQAQPQRQGSEEQGKQGDQNRTTGQGNQDNKQGQPSRQGQREQGKQQPGQTTGQGGQNRQDQRQGQNQNRQEQPGARDRTTGQGQQPSQPPRTGQNQDRNNEGRNGRVELNDQQRTHIRQTILARSDVPREARVDFQLNVGVVVPQRVRLVAVPDALIEIRPEWRGHQFFVVRDEIIIVDSSRHIVATLPVGEQVGSNQDRNNEGRNGRVE